MEPNNNYCQPVQKRSYSAILDDFLKHVNTVENKSTKPSKKADDEILFAKIWFKVDFTNTNDSKFLTINCNLLWCFLLDCVKSSISFIISSVHSLLFFESILFVSLHILIYFYLFYLNSKHFEIKNIRVSGQKKINGQKCLNGQFINGRIKNWIFFNNRILF